MKRMLFVGILLAMSICSGISQIQKKTFLIGGYADIEINKYDSEFSFNPNSAIFLTDKLCLGISLPLEYTSEKLYWDFTPFGRYYLSPAESSSVYFSGFVGLKNILELGSALTDKKMGLGIGHVWFLNQSIGLEAELQGNTDFRNVGLGMYVGFQIYFNRSND
ncbi:hypothetical protein [Carboxylicivirga linearis]|uniref:Outer membrane protein beta-barrel domain-containing protein n=1 Tax=Carboxylicivirga linearis TaxID=1628157 RepID=A0ABS5K0N3_9BACT|nr:hypothetical protein [Carboxylicivirga linearis]MBS2100269.1 hypothetical protein [Carboxylicivirga linearis]